MVIMGATANATELQDFAIVIGVNYPSGTLSGLKGTRNDAAAFVEWLRSASGGNVPKDNIRTVRSPARAQRSARTAKPIQEEIDDALEELGVSLSKKPVGRRLYFYFSGHGFGRHADEVCMLMAHATKKRLNLNIGLREYRNFFQEHGYFQEIMFILDCCRDPEPPLSGTVPQPPTWTVDADSPPPIVSDLVILAAANGKKAHETDDPKTGNPRGIFTLALLDVLSGRAGVDVQGRHTAFNLRDNLDARMQALVGANEGAIAGQRAMVETRDNLNTGLVLMAVQVPSTSTVPVRIIAPAGAKGDFIVLEGTTNEVARHPAAHATEEQPPWQVDLSPTKFYSVRHQKSASAPALFAVIDWAQLEATKKDGGYVFVFPEV
jgi:hypothetical protein